MNPVLSPSSEGADQFANRSSLAHQSTPPNIDNPGQLGASLLTTSLLPSAKPPRAFTAALKKQKQYRQRYLRQATQNKDLQLFINDQSKIQSEKEKEIRAISFKALRDLFFLVIAVLIFLSGIALSMVALNGGAIVVLGLAITQPTQLAGLLMFIGACGFAFSTVSIYLSIKEIVGVAHRVVTNDEMGLTTTAHIGNRLKYRHSNGTNRVLTSRDPDVNSDNDNHHPTVERSAMRTYHMYNRMNFCDSVSVIDPTEQHDGDKNAKESMGSDSLSSSSSSLSSST